MISRYWPSCRAGCSGSISESSFLGISQISFTDFDKQINVPVNDPAYCRGLTGFILFSKSGMRMEN